MLDIKSILDEDMTPADVDKYLKKYFDKYVKDILDNQLAIINPNISVDFTNYPTAMFCQIDPEDNKDHEYSMDIYGYINNDGVYVAELSLITNYTKDFSKGNTFAEITREDDYQIEDIDYCISAQVNDLPFKWGEVIHKLFINESLNEIISYPNNDLL